MTQHTPPQHLQNSKPKRVAILVYPDLCTFEFGCAVELFALPRPNIHNWYQTDIIALQAESVNAVGGFQVNSNITLSQENGFKEYDMVVIAGWSGVDFHVPEILIHSLQAFHLNGGTLLSFCGGAFVLASTGLLNHKTATTHWHYQDQFIEMYPQIDFQKNVLYTEEERLYTSAGSASALDLGLHIIRKDYGASIANEVAKRLVISPQRAGGQAQYAQQTALEAPDLLSTSLQWAMDNLQNTISINQMAEKACLSRRSFDRHFRQVLNISPKEWLTRQRIDLAREYLESSKVSIDQIAEQSGFGTAMNLRHHFGQVLGVTPSHYRNQFLKGS